MQILKKGSRGRDVLTLQKALADKGFLVAQDGVFGVNTEAVVEKFQEANHLIKDGIVGAQTWDALGIHPMKYIMGVDVSHYETGFDFAKGVKDGVVFMMTKASEGTGLDNTCVSECKKAAAAGVKYKGIYHFFHAHINVASQISAFFKQYSAVKTEMSPILDLEETSVNGKSPAQVKDAALDWLFQAEQKSGKVPMLYIDVNMINVLGILKDSRFNKYPLWVARYSSSEPAVAWMFWQFTDKGEQGADTDWFHGDEAALKAFLNIA